MATEGFEHNLSEEAFVKRITDLPMSTIVRETCTNTAQICVALGLANECGQTEFAKAMLIADFKRAIAALERNVEACVAAHVEGSRIVKAEKVRVANGGVETVEV